jgi:DNA mismatch repair protein MSH5
VVKAGVDRELDLLKDRYNGLDSLLKQVAIDVASTIPTNLGIDVNVIYFPQLGFNIAIPFNERGLAAYTGEDDSWEQIFTTENRAYFKDSRMREMDEKLGDIYGLICGTGIRNPLVHLRFPCFFSDNFQKGKSRFPMSSCREF